MRQQYQVPLIFSGPSPARLADSGRRMPLDNRALKTDPVSLEAVDSNPVAAASSESTLVPWHVRLVREMAIHDWIVLGYLIVLTAAVALSPASSIRSICLGHVVTMLGICLAVLILVRGALLRDNLLAPLLYRLGVYGTVQISYFELRELLPLVNPTSLDAQLSYIDERVLHFEPSLFMDRLVSPATTEWFAFFYFGYFALLASHVLPLLFFSRRLKLVGEFGLGMIFLYSFAHIIYMLVPGYGPVRYLAGQYQHELPPGIWLNAVMDAVGSGGAQKDIFPSLHTAGPVYLSLFSFRHRDKTPFKSLALRVVFQREHRDRHDVPALALSDRRSRRPHPGVRWLRVGGGLSSREISYREENGLGPVWMPLKFRPLPSPLPAAPKVER